MNLGAYTVFFWPLRKGLSMMQSVYDIPAVHFQGHAVLTNTAPTAVYRSAGRPEAIYMIERLIELAADTCGFDRVELRRRNLIPPDAMPYTNGVGATYDSGNYLAAMDRALDEADWAGFPSRRAEAAARGLCRGIGVANYIEITSGIPRERAELTVCDDGCIEFVVGTMSSGQGHETSFPQLLCEWLQIPFEKVRYITNDTDRVSVGGGSHSGRSMRLVSIALGEAVAELLAKGKAIAAHILQAAEDDITFQDGAFAAPGGGSMDLWEVARAAGGLESAGDITNRAGGYPYGAHVCEVEVDPDTGTLEIVKYTAVDDFGVLVNPMIVEGQVHGGLAHGIGQALLEGCVYDDDTGQLVTGSFQDYCMPRADNLPSFDVDYAPTVPLHNPLGVKGCGEAGAIAAPPAVINAIVNALGIKHLDMPATPEKVWRAAQAAG